MGGAWLGKMIAAMIVASLLPGCDRAAPSSPATPRAKSSTPRADSTTRSLPNVVDIVPEPREANEASTWERPSAPSSADSADRQAEPQPIHRPDDQRPKHDDRRLAEVGIRLYESKGLKLYTDIDAEVARTLPPVIDAVYLAWGEYFGKLPPDLIDSEFQMTGYLIRDEALFREANLVPEDLPTAGAPSPFWFTGSYTADLLDDATGGLDPGPGYIDLLKVSAAFDGSAVGRRGLTGPVSIEHVFGADLTLNRVGGIQSVSASEALRAALSSTKPGYNRKSPTV